jgi:membrane protease YdiL (CAAX protease family)
MNANPYEPPEVANDDRVPSAEIVTAEVVAEPTFFLDGSQRLRTVWRFLIFGAGCIAANMVVATVVGIVLVIWLLVSQGPEALSEFAFSSANELTDQHGLFLTALSSVPITAAILGWVVVCRKYIDRRSIASMGFVRPEQGPGASVVVGFLAGFLPIAAASGAVAAAGGFRLDGFGFSVMAGFLVPALILMAFMEELIFRAYLLQNLLDIRRPVFGVIFTSVFFWLAHAMNPDVWTSVFITPINMFGAGVVLALAYMVSRNIWFPTALHFGWNLAQGVLLSLPISGMKAGGLIRLRANDSAPAWLTGGGFGLEASVAVTVVELLMISGFLLLLQRRARHAETVAGSGDPATTE